MPLKSPLSTDLLHLHKNSSSALDTFSHLQTFSQTRYPLVNSMHSPFVPFSPTSISPLYQTSANIDALKQYGLAIPHYVSQFTAKAIEADQKYKDNLSVSANHENIISFIKSRFLKYFSSQHSCNYICKPRAILCLTFTIFKQTLSIEGANIQNRTPTPSDERKAFKITKQSSMNFEKQSQVSSRHFVLNFALGK